MLTGKHFYHSTIKKLIAVFGTLFNNISIVQVRSEIEAKVIKTRVPIAYGNRSKFLTRIREQEQITGDPNRIAIKLPRMSFEITSISYDTSIKLAKHQKIVPCAASENKNERKWTYMSVPYRIGFDLNILAKNQDDALQILEQILPTFSPEYSVIIKDIEIPGGKTVVPFVLNNISFQDDFEGMPETRRTLIYTLSFETRIRFSGNIYSNPIIRVTESRMRTTMNTSAPPEEIIKVYVGPDDTPENHTVITEILPGEFEFAPLEPEASPSPSLDLLIPVLPEETPDYDDYID